MSEVEVSRSNVKRPPKIKPELKTKIPGRPKNIQQMEKKGAFLVKQFGGIKELSALVVDGHYTPRAFSAWEVGERPPKTILQSDLLAQKGQRLLDRVFRLKNLK